MEAYDRLYEHAEVTVSKKVQDYTDGYHEQNNPCIEFVQMYEKSHFINKRPPEVYEEYVLWSDENIEAGKAQSNRQLNETIQNICGLIIGQKWYNGRNAKVWREPKECVKS